MKKLVTIIGVLLVIAGIFTYAYRYINYTTSEEVAKIGSVQVTNETEKTIVIAPMLSGGMVVVGVVLVALGLGLSRKP